MVMAVGYLGTLDLPREVEKVTAMQWCWRLPGMIDGDVRDDYLGTYLFKASITSSIYLRLNTPLRI